MSARGLHIQCRDEPGVLHQLTGEIAAANANVVTVETGTRHEGVVNIYFELDGDDIDGIAAHLRAQGIPVISLKQVGSVTEAADLVVSDPLQAGVMAVMAIARTARFDLDRVRGQTF